MQVHFLTTRPEKHLIAVIVLLAVFGGAWLLQAQEPATLVIMHTNDLHGQVLPRNGIGGIAEIATIIKSNNPDLILDAGDMFTGTVVTDEFQGLPIIEAMSRIGFHAAALGNHEFDYGVAALRQRARDAKFLILSANIDTRIPEIGKYTVLTRKGVRVGIIGLTTDAVRTTTHPKNLENMVVRDAVQAVRDILPEVSSRSDVLIIVSHMDRSEEQRVAAAFPEIPLIVSGHTHNTVGPYQLGQTTVVKTGSSGRNVGKVVLQVQGKSVIDLKATLIPVTNVQPDPEISAIIRPYEAKVAEKMSLVLGQATADLNRSTDSESPLANIIADAFREKTKAQIAMQNPGGIRANLPRGPITWGRVFEILPFQNTLVTLEMSGAQVKKVLGRILLAVSGVRVQLDLKKPEGERLVSAVLADGTPINDTEIYTVTTNDFVVAGGDGLIEFGQGRNIRDSAVFLRDAMVEYIKANPVVSPRLDGRVKVN